MPQQSLVRAGSTTAEPPVARRLRPPSWRDPRLAVGLVLVLGSVAAGASVLRAADDTVPVLVAQRTLTPGQALGPGDVSVARVRIPGGQARYVPGPAAPAGLVVLRLVPSGELVARSAVGSREQVDLRPVSVPVGQDVAAALGAGVLVDVWVATPEPARGADAFARPRQVATGVQVAGRTTARGALGSSTASSVQLLLTPALVPELIQAIDNRARITLVPVPATLARTGP